MICWRIDEERCDMLCACSRSLIGRLYATFNTSLLPTILLILWVSLFFPLCFQLLLRSTSRFIEFLQHILRFRILKWRCMKLPHITDIESKRECIHKMLRIDSIWWKESGRRKELNSCEIPLPSFTRFRLKVFSNECTGKVPRNSPLVPCILANLFSHTVVTIKFSGGFTGEE